MIRVKSMLFSPAAFGIGIVCAVAAVFYVWGLMILFALVARTDEVSHMTILYRSPDVQIDAHRWHVVVARSPRNGRVATVFRFRQTSKEAWRPSTSWPGRLPKGMRDQFFRPFLRSIEITKKHAFD